MSHPAALRVVSLESRHEAELARLLERHGCIAICAPSLREVPLADQHEALAFGEQLMAHACDVLVLLTGVGARLLVESLVTRWPRAAVLAALSSTMLVCRGPKPVAALKALGLRASAVAAEPNTWQEVLSVMERDVAVAGKRVHIQEYGKLSPQLAEALRQRGAHVASVSVYAWAMPEDVGPLYGAVDALCAEQAEAIIFTSGKQIEHLLEAATARGMADSVRAVLRKRVVVASMGPMTSEALREFGVAVDLEPLHPKMGHLVLALAADGWRLHAAKAGR